LRIRRSVIKERGSARARHAVPLLRHLGGKQLRLLLIPAIRSNLDHQEP
jgi:hypothetical protein